MYKVTDVSAPTPCFTSSYNDLLSENTVFAVWLCEKAVWFLVYDLQTPAWSPVR